MQQEKSPNAVIQCSSQLLKALVLQAFRRTWYRKSAHPTVMHTRRERPLCRSAKISANPTANHKPVGDDFLRVQNNAPTVGADFHVRPNTVGFCINLTAIRNRARADVLIRSGTVEFLHRPIVISYPVGAIHESPAKSEQIEGKM